MKYNYNCEIIPQEMRKGINNKIEYIINNNIPEEESGISKEDIFNAYTGLGGLHRLEFKNYNNYHAYQVDKAEIEQGQFFTPYKLVEYIYECLNIKDTDLIADLTCGHGSFASCAPNERNFYGCELELNSYKVARYLYPDANIENNDIRFYEPKVSFDYVLGNPPYSMYFRVNRQEYKSEFYYFLKAYDLLKPGGIICAIVPLSFCSDEFSDGGMIKELNKRFNFICQIALDKNTFSHLGVTNYKTKVVFLQKKSDFLKNSDFSTKILHENVSSEYIFNNFISKINEKREELKRKLMLELVKQGDQSKEWQFKVNKLLFDIKQNPKTCVRYGECLAFIEKFKTQKKPESIKFDEWQQMRIKDYEVVQFLKKILSEQHGKKIKNLGIVKNKYDFSLDGYKINIASAVYNGNFEDLPFKNKKMIDFLTKKREKFEKQSLSYGKMGTKKDINKWLSEFELVSDDKKITLNDMQKHDLNLFLQKDYNFIQWEQGSGKTIAGITIGKYRLEHNNCKCVFVVSTAIAIKNNWVDVLTDFNIPFKTITSKKDITDLNGKFVLITLGMMIKYEKFIKKYVKSISQKALLIFDESDNISNQDSKCTKAILNCFRRLKYKTLMTGTSTRNNIAEIYPQLELLYNNSYNMISECTEIQEKQKDGELKFVKNENYGKPYPSYKQGYKLFTASHIPEKITVFGVGQLTQDVYNSEVLKKMINKTIITRTFEEITGKKLYEIKQVHCVMNKEEKKLYKTAIEEFYKLEYLYSKTGNSRKDAMLKILNQLLTLLKICAASNTFSEYESNELPNKMKKVIEIVKENNERIAIGVRHINVLKSYENELKKEFPDRKIFVITGNETSLKQRKDIIKELEQTENGILISTQQSLSASMNIDFIDKCIIPELHWNNSSMSQYYFRFIRYTSTRFKTVYFVTYENSIESNLLKMILVKDKLNRFMKNQGNTDEEIYDMFGIDSNVLENLMYREKTEDGYVIRWGSQEIN